MNRGILAILLVAIFANVQALTDEQKVKDTEITKACAKQLGVDPKKALALRNGEKVEPDPKFPCFAKCVLEKYNGFKDGALDTKVAIDVLSSNVDKKVVEQIVHRCAALKGTNDCETSFKIFKCFVQHKDALKL